jgi:hypothetical protein
VTLGTAERIRERQVVASIAGHQLLGESSDIWLRLLQAINY